jgi:hypothetical protein
MGTLTKGHDSVIGVTDRPTDRQTDNISLFFTSSHKSDTAIMRFIGYITGTIG